MGQKFSNENVEKIALKDKKIKVLEADDGITFYKKLKAASFKRNEISSISPALCKELRTIPKLTDTLVKLDLSRNSLKELPDEICLLTNLTRLHLEMNRLVKLPEEFPRLYKLEKLYLSDNYLESLPPNFRNMQNLRVLELHQNRLCWLPNDIGEMIWLDEISIENNDIDQALFEFSNLISLLNYIKLNQRIDRKYKTHHQTYLKKYKEIRTQVKQRTGYFELKDKRMKAFLQMLQDNSCWSTFHRFLKKEYAAENLNFYGECLKFRDTFYSDYPLSSKEVYTHVKAIYTKFIDDGDDSSHAINIPSEIKNKIEEAIKNKKVDQFIFSEAQVAILKLLLFDSMNRFKDTKEGKGIWSTYFEDI